MLIFKKGDGQLKDNFFTIIHRNTKEYFQFVT